MANNTNPNDEYALGYTNPGATGLNKQNIANNTISNLSLQNSINTQGVLAQQAAQQQMPQQQQQLPTRPTKPNTQSNNFIPEESAPSQAQIQPQVQAQIEPHTVGTDAQGKPTLDGQPWIPEEEPEQVESGSSIKVQDGEVHTAPFKGNDTPQGQEIENKPKKRSGIDVFNKYTDYIEGRSEGDDLLKNFSKTGLRDGLPIPWVTGEQGLMIDLDPINVFPDDSYADRHLQGALKYAKEKGISPDQALFAIKSLPQAAQSNGNPDADILYYELTGNSLGLASRAFINKAELLGYKVKVGELTEEQAQKELEDFKKNISKDPQFEQRWFGNDRGSRQVLSDLIGQGAGAALGYAGSKILSSNFGRNLGQKALKAADKAFAKVIEKSPDKVYKALQKSGLIDDVAAIVDSPVKQAAAKRLAENSVKSGYYDELTGVFSDLETKAYSINAVRQLEKEIRAKYPNASDEKIATALYDYAFNKNPKGELAFEIRDAFRGTNLSEDAIDSLLRTQKYHIEHPEHTQLAEDIINRYTEEFANKTPEEVAQILKDHATDGGMSEKYWKLTPEYEKWLKSGKKGDRPSIQYQTFHWKDSGKGSYYPSKEAYDAFNKELEGYYQYIDDLTKYSSLADQEEKEIFNDIGILNMNAARPKDADIIAKEAIKNPKAVVDSTDDGSIMARFIKRTLDNKLTSGEKPESKTTEGKVGGKSAEGKAGSNIITKGAAEGGALLGGALGDHIQSTLGSPEVKSDITSPKGVTENPVGLNSLGNGDSSYIPYRGPKLDEPLTWEGHENYREVYDKLNSDIQAAEKKGRITPEEADALQERATMYNSFIRSIQNSPLNDVPDIIEKVEKAQGKVNDYSTARMPKTWLGAYLSGEFGDPKSKDAKRTLAYFTLNSLGTALMNSAAVIQKRATTDTQWNISQGEKLSLANKRYDNAKTRAFENNLDSIAKAMNMSLEQKNKVIDLMSEGKIKLLYDKLGDTRKIDLLEKVARFAPYYNKLSDNQKAAMAAIMIDSGLTPRDELSLLSTNFSKRQIAELIGGMKNAEYLNKMYNSHVTQKQVELVGAQLQQVLQAARLTEAEANLYAIKVYAELADKGVDAALNLIKSLLPGGSK
jgi:hypothetical protein